MLIIRVQDLGDIFGDHFVFDGAIVVAVVECSEVEGLHGLCFPEAQAIAGSDPIAEDWGIISHTLDDGIRYPAHAVATPVVRPVLGVSAERHIECQLRSHNLPGIAVTKPFIGNLDLPAVAYDL